MGKLSGVGQFTSSLASRVSFPQVGRQSVCLCVIKEFLVQNLQSLINFFNFLCELKQKYLLGPRGQDTGIAVYMKQSNGPTGSAFSARFSLGQATGLSHPCLLLDKLQVGFSGLPHFSYFLVFYGRSFYKGACYCLCLHI